MLTKSQLKELFFKYNFSPLKRFGENYLIDANIKDKIIEAVAPKKGDIILEIGPGLGALTIDLARSGAKIFAVEKDRKAFDILQEMIGDACPNLKIFNEDILDFKINLITSEKSPKIKVVGNLPYYITTPIIEYLIENRNLITSIVIMTQREVTNRLLASPGRKDYSSVSCFVQYYTKTQYIHTIKPASFYPEPEVDSSLIRLDVFDKPPVDVKDEALFFKIIRGSFNQRRKTILNSLSREAVLDISKDELVLILKKAEVDPASRPESLSLSDFANIANLTKS